MQKDEKNMIVEKRNKRNELITRICLFLAGLQYLITLLSALLDSEVRSRFMISITSIFFFLFVGVQLLERRIKRQLMPILFVVLGICMILSTYYFLLTINWWPML